MKRHKYAYKQISSVGKSVMDRIGLFILWIVLILFPANALASGTEIFAVDPVHSTAFFKVGHYGFGFVRGVFTDISGTIVIDKAAHTGSKVDIVIHTGSINTNNTQRDAHLKSKDFFDVKSFPTMGFKSTQVKKLSNNLYEAAGDFTLHGVTQSIKVQVRFIGEGEDHYGMYRVGFETEFSINRSDYGMTKYIPAAGDKVDISLIIEGIKKERDAHSQQSGG